VVSVDLPLLCKSLHLGSTTSRLGERPLREILRSASFLSPEGFSASVVWRGLEVLSVVRELTLTGPVPVRRCRGKDRDWASHACCRSLTIAGGQILTRRDSHKEHPGLPRDHEAFEIWLKTDPEPVRADPHACPGTRSSCGLGINVRLSWHFPRLL